MAAPPKQSRTGAPAARVAERARSVASSTALLGRRRPLRLVDGVVKPDGAGHSGAADIAVAVERR